MKQKKEKILTWAKVASKNSFISCAPFMFFLLVSVFLHLSFVLLSPRTYRLCPLYFACYIVLLWSMPSVLCSRLLLFIYSLCSCLLSYILCLACSIFHNLLVSCVCCLLSFVYHQWSGAIAKVVEISSIWFLEAWKYQKSAAATRI